MAKAGERRHPPRGRFVDVDGVRLHYTEQGKGHPVLLLHGNGGMVEELFSSGLPSRLAAHCRVLIFGHPAVGHGMSRVGLA